MSSFSSIPPVNGEAEQDDNDGEERSGLKVVATPEPNKRRRGNVLQQTQVRVQTHLNVLPVELDPAGAHLVGYGYIDSESLFDGANAGNVKHS